MAVRRAASRRAGFSLVELMIVIAIIIALAALLMPAIWRAREISRQAQCINNLRQIALAGIQYYNAQGYYPPYRLEDPTIAQQFAVQRPRWQWLIAPFMGEPSQDVDQLPAYLATDPTGTNAPLLPKTFQCPSLTLATNDNAGAPYYVSIRSGAYGYNFAYLGNSRVLSDNNTSSSPGDPYLNFPVKGVADPARTVMFGDSRGGNIPHGDHSMTLDGPHERVSTLPAGSAYGSSSPALIPGYDPYGPDEGTGGGIVIPFSPAEARHFGKANVSFCDGHAESMTLVDLGYTQFDAAGNPLPQTAAISWSTTTLTSTWGDNRFFTGRGLDDLSPNYGAVQNLQLTSPKNAN